MKFVKFIKLMKLTTFQHSICTKSFFVPQTLELDEINY